MRDYIPYGKQWLDDEDINAVIKTLKSDFLTQGSKVDEFENAICEYTGAKYCVAVANGTAALHIAIAAAELEEGSEGITSPITFVASSNAMLYNGIKPIFADIDEKTYNVDIDKIKKRVTAKTKLIIPVHFAGQPVEMAELSSWTKGKGLVTIEDASHAIGSRYKCGTYVGSCKYCDMTIFSFHPVKTITTGEGGAITTNSKELYDKLRLLRSHGITKSPEDMNRESPGPWYYEMQELGFNYRITDIQCALGIRQLKRLDGFIKRRREIINKYNKAFENCSTVITPYEINKGYSAFHLYVLLFDFKSIGKTRKEVMEELAKLGVGTQVHYIPVHTQPYYNKRLGYKWGDYPIAEDYYERALSIPLYPKMTDDDVNYVIDKILEVAGKIDE